MTQTFCLQVYQSTFSSAWYYQTTLFNRVLWVLLVQLSQHSEIAGTRWQIFQPGPLWIVQLTYCKQRI